MGERGSTKRTSILRGGKGLGDRNEKARYSQKRLRNGVCLETQQLRELELLPDPLMKARKEHPGKR